MEMQTKIVELRMLKAAEGMVLTDGENYSSVSGEVYLGVNDSPDNWHEITEEEYNERITNEEHAE